MLVRKIALVLVLVFAFTAVVSPAFALSPALQEIRNLKESGKWSNKYINQSVICLKSLSSGTVVTYTYIGANEELTIKNLSVKAQPNPSATNKITRFMFTLTNQYRPETTLPLSVSGDKNTVHAYAYGTLKDEAIWAVVNGLVDCLGNPPIDNTPNNDDDDDSDDKSTGSSGKSETSWVDKYYPDQIADTIAEATFSVDSKTVTVGDDSTSEPQTIDMDVSPEITKSKVFIPVKYIARTLGADIKWDNLSKTATVIGDNATIILAIGSTSGLINGKTIKMESAPYIKNGRVMVQAKYIAEPLGAKVKHDSATKQITITQTQEIQTEQGSK